MRQRLLPAAGLTWEEGLRHENMSATCRSEKDVLIALPLTVVEQ